MNVRIAGKAAWGREIESRAGKMGLTDEPINHQKRIRETRGFDFLGRLDGHIRTVQVTRGVSK